MQGAVNHVDRLRTGVHEYESRRFHRIRQVSVYYVEDRISFQTPIRYSLH